MRVVVHSLVGAAAEVSVAEACEEVSGDGRQQRSEFDVQPRFNHMILGHIEAPRQIHHRDTGHTGALRDRQRHGGAAAVKAHGICVSVCAGLPWTSRRPKRRWWVPSGAGRGLRQAPMGRRHTSGSFAWGRPTETIKTAQVRLCVYSITCVWSLFTLWPELQCLWYSGHNVLSTWKEKTQNLENIFQTSDNIWRELSHKCFLCSNYINKKADISGWSSGHCLKDTQYSVMLTI